MRSFAPDISKVDHERPGQFALKPKAPLLSVWPNRLGRNRGDIDRKGNAARRRITTARAGTFGVVSLPRNPIPDITDAGQADGERLRHAENHRRACLEGTGVRFVARAML